MSAPEEDTIWLVTGTAAKTLAFPAEEEALGYIEDEDAHLTAEPVEFVSGGEPAFYDFDTSHTNWESKLDPIPTDETGGHE